MDLSVTSRLALFVIVTLASVNGAPAAQNHISSDSLISLQNIILKLQNSVIELQNFARSLQSNAASNRDMLGDPEPEFDLSELQKIAAASKSANQQQLSNVDAQKPVAKQQSAAAAVPSSADLDSNDISLREALQYLVSLAKEKKLERRDHDIPFPLYDRDGQ